MLVRMAIILTGLVLLTGCRPNQANIELRRENQDLKDSIQRLETERAADRARIEGLEARSPRPATQATLDELFTVHSVALGRLSLASPQRVKLYLSPLDQEGSPAKATARVSIDALDLRPAGNNVIGHWELSPEDIKSRWRSLGPLNAFVLELPWTQPPQTTAVGVKITWEDALTGRVFHLLEHLTWEPNPDPQPLTTGN
jgi:hypothetical protein